MVDCINKDREIIKIVNDLNYSNEFDQIFSSMTSSINTKPISQLSRQEMIDLLMKLEKNETTKNESDDDQPIDI